jgi:signal transduction histidine kinase
VRQVVLRWWCGGREVIATVLVGVAGLWALGVPAVLVVAGLLATAAAGPLTLAPAPPARGLRRLAGLGGERFQDGLEYAAALRGLSDEVGRLSGVEAIAGYVLTWLRQMLTLRWAAIVLCEERRDAAVFRWGDCPADLDLIGLAAPGGADAASGAAVVPLVAGGGRIGALVLGPRRRDAELSIRERALVDLVAPLAALALQNASLLRRAGELATAADERERDLTSLAARLTGAQEDERRRIALELHDEPLQRAILLYREISVAAAHPRAERWLAEVEEIVTSLRATCNGLRPRVLDDFGLAAGLEWLVNDVRARSDVDVGLTTVMADAAPGRRLPADLELALFRIVQEALNNCLKHADARRVNVTLWRAGGPIRLTVADDGRGFDGEPAGGHLGIRGMRERLRPWNGCVTVGRGPAGGTVVVAELPLEVELVSAE